MILIVFILAALASSAQSAEVLFTEDFETDLSLWIPQAGYDHSAQMFRLKGDEIMGDLRPRSASRLAILPNTTHVTLMERMSTIVPMVIDFFDAMPQTTSPDQGGHRPEGGR